jgi:hypothetical protein
VDDGIVPSQPALQVRFISQVTLDEVDARWYGVGVARRKVVKHGDFVPRAQQRRDDVAADEPCTAGYEYAHINILARTVPRDIDEGPVRRVAPD